MSLLNVSLDEEPKMKEKKINIEKVEQSPDNMPDTINKNKTIETQKSRFIRPTIEKSDIQTVPKDKKCQSRPVGRPSIANKSTIQAKAIPRDILELARRDAGIPSTVSNSNAVAAYIYMKAADKSDITLTEELKTIIKECNGDSVVQNMNDKISILENELRNMEKKMDEMLLALNYLILNATGLSYESANTASDVNLLEEGVLDIRENLRRQTKKLRNMDNNNGRPFR